jgi:hypothetical protein
MPNDNENKKQYISCAVPAAVLVKIPFFLGHDAIYIITNVPVYMVSYPTRPESARHVCALVYQHSVYLCASTSVLWTNEIETVTFENRVYLTNVTVL